MFAAPLWSSPFRPFYAAGALYGPLLMLAWLAQHAGWASLPLPAYPLALWHGHEFVFGFAAAIIIGILYTALPSWANTREIRGAPLALLVALWAIGRAAMWLSPWLPRALTAVLDCAFFLAAFLMVMPGLFAASEKLYLAVLPVLLGLLLGNALFHVSLIAGDPGEASFGLRAGLYAIVLLYALKGGYLTPIFTRNRLRERGRGDVTFNVPLEWTAIAVTVAFIFSDLTGADPAARAAIAFGCAGIHAVRLARWQGWKVADTPLLWAMHLGYGWMVAAMGLRGAQDVGLAPPGSWIHAFTVGALGMMMLGLTTRVTLRHTGRDLVVPPSLVLAYWMMMAAAVLRVSAALAGMGVGLITLSVLLWSAPFAIYLASMGGMLFQPSLPRLPPGAIPISVRRT